MLPRCLLIPALLLSALIPAWQAEAATAGGGTSGNLFCCTDANGKQVCGDLLPQSCYGRAYREVGASGRTVRQVEAPLTAEQRAERAAEEEKRKAAAEAAKEQQRKDQALLNTYGSEKDIETMRERANADVDKSISEAQAKIAAIKVQRKKFEDEAEFYKKKTLPATVKKGLTDTDFEIKAQQSIIEAKQKEREIIRQKYDDDTRRYRELKQRSPSN